MKNSFLYHQNNQFRPNTLQSNEDSGSASPRSSQENRPSIPRPTPGEGGPVAPGSGNRPVTPLPNPGEGGPVTPGGGNRPVAPLPNPGEGGPVAPSGGNRPVAPLPNPGEGGPITPDGGRPIAPLPNPGEGGPVAPGGGNRPVAPLPNPGEGGPVAPNGGNRPIAPLPNPGEGGPVAPGPSITIPSIIGTIITSFPRPNAPCRFCNFPNQNSSNVRFLNAASNYNPFQVYINDQLFVSDFGFAEVTAYDKVPSGYQIITVTGNGQYIYIQKPVMIPRDSSVTIAICNTENGLDLFLISDYSCERNNRTSCLRVCNLSFNSGPLSTVIGNNDARFMNVGYQEVTDYKAITPAEYVFFVMNGNQNILLSSTIQLMTNVSSTIYLFNWNISSPDAIQALIIQEH